MYIRRVKKSGTSFSVRIVEGHRDSKGQVKQKVIKTVGTGKNEQEIQILERAAREMILSLTPRTGMSTSISKNEIPDDVRLNQLVEIRRVNDGILDIFGKLYSEFGFNHLIQNTYKDKQWNEILMALVLARIVEPNSKRKTATMLSKKYMTNIPLEKIYRAMDKIFEHESIIKDAVTRETKKFHNGKITMMLFDVTTLYFESTEVDELKNRGFSKDCKFKEVQIVLSLTTTTDGLPLDYSVFPGNTSEGKTLLANVEHLIKHYNINEVTLIADRAMFTNDNLSQLEKLGIKYIVACKLRSLIKEIKNRILTDKDYRANVVKDELHWAKEYEYNNRRLIVSYSAKRAYCDQKHREQLIERLVKKTKNEKIKAGDLINNNGSKKFIKIINSDIEIDQKKIIQDTVWDGIHGVITNCDDKNIFNILVSYRQLWRIEEAFRINKHDIQMRPIFHWKPSRIKAHIAICYLAFALGKFALKQLENVGINISFDELRKELSEVESSILINNPDKEKSQCYLLPSPLTPAQRIIYDGYKVIRRETPWAL
jgi:transposase